MFLTFFIYKTLNGISKRTNSHPKWIFACPSFSENVIENASNDSSAFEIGTLNLRTSLSGLYLEAPHILVALFIIKVISLLSGIVKIV